MKGIEDIEQMIKMNYEKCLEELEERGVLCEKHQTKHLPEKVCRACEDDAKVLSKRQALLDGRGVPLRYQNMWLDDYVADSDGQKKAMVAAKRLAAFDIKSLLFTGTCGTGKTHLAVSLINMWLYDYSITTQYTTAAKIIRSVKDCWGGKGSEQEVIDRWSKYDYLVVDELGASFGSETEQMILSEIMCERYNLGKRTVMISNLAMDELKKVFDERVISRLRQDAVLVVFDWDDERAKK